MRFLSDVQESALGGVNFHGFFSLCNQLMLQFSFLVVKCVSYKRHKMLNNENNNKNLIMKKNVSLTLYSAMEEKKNQFLEQL